MHVPFTDKELKRKTGVNVIFFIVLGAKCTRYTEVQGKREIKHS